MTQYDNNRRGTLGKNERREKETHPEYTGKCEIDGKLYWISAWIKEGQGRKFFSLSFKAQDQQPASRSVAGAQRPNKPELDAAPLPHLYASRVEALQAVIDGECDLAICKATAEAILHYLDGNAPLPVSQQQPQASCLPPAWMPIETAPKDADGPHILLSNGTQVSQGWWCDELGYIREKRDLDGVYIDQDESDGYTGWLDCGGGMVPEPTHWMPLPTSPQSGETEA